MANNEENQEKEVGAGEEPDSPEVHFEPLVKLSLVENKTLEENEEVILQIRAKLFRYDTESDPKEWKERGVGECRILKHRETGFIRLLMRRDQTLKICANHYILPNMKLKPNCGSDRAWVWNTNADFADEESKEEVLAIRFKNADNAQKFKTVFEESQATMKELLQESEKKTEQTNGEKEGEVSGEKEGEVSVSGEKEGEVSGDDSDDRPEADQLSGQLKELSVKEG